MNKRETYGGKFVGKKGERHDYDLHVAWSDDASEEELEMKRGAHRAGIELNPLCEEGYVVSPCTEEDLCHENDQSD